MVYPTASTKPEYFTVSSMQDVFDILSQGLDVYNQKTSGPAAKQADNQNKARPESEHQGSSLKRKSFSPDLDLTETSNAVIVEVSLPGVDKSTIGIEYDAKQNNVVLSGEFKKPERGDDVKIIRTERPHGKYERIVTLGQQAVLADSIAAQYTDGVLVVTIPKNKDVEHKKKISVQ